MNQSKRIWDRIAERYAKQPIGDEAAYRKKLQVTPEYFQPDVKVLEFGRGTGSTAIAHAPYVKHIRAIDVSSSMIEIAQRKANADNVENVTFEQSTIEELGVANQLTLLSERPNFTSHVRCCPGDVILGALGPLYHQCFQGYAESFE